MARLLCARGTSHHLTFWLKPHASCMSLPLFLGEWTSEIGSESSSEMGLLIEKEIMFILVYHPKCLNGVSVTRRKLTVQIRVRAYVGVKLLTLFLLSWSLKVQEWYRDLFSHCVGRNCNFLFCHWLGF